MRLFSRLAAVAAMVVLACGAPVLAAAPFEVNYLDGSQWNNVFVQGFSPSVEPIADPGLAAGDTVYLEYFQFEKSGNADVPNLRLAILNNIFTDLTGLSTTHGAFVALSNNTLATTASVATNDMMTFDFGGLPLTYGNNYAAVLVTVGGDMTTLTPTLGPVITADYVENPPGSGNFVPETNYGTTAQFTYATSNFIATNAFGSFFNTFSFAGDANFRARFSIPEPSSVLLVLCGLVGLGGRRFLRR
jgi:hypothetical protein